MSTLYILRGANEGCNQRGRFFCNLSKSGRERVDHATGSTPCSRMCRAASTTSSTRWSPNCSGAASSGEGKTLRENLGLPRPENRFFSKPKG
jgi:hypothetical protein